jgi:hypothetical protein
VLISYVASMPAPGRCAVVHERLKCALPSYIPVARCCKATHGVDEYCAWYRFQVPGQAGVSRFYAFEDTALRYAAVSI